MVYNFLLRGMEDSQIIQKEISSLKLKQQIKFHDANQKHVIKSTLINASSLFKNQLLPIESDISDGKAKEAKNLNDLHSNHQKLHCSPDANSSDDEDEIDLHPLSNQVGGHTRLLLLNEKTVIKPLNTRELEFYQNIPNNSMIQQFVPKYKGN